MTTNKEENQIPSDISQSRIRKEWGLYEHKIPEGHLKASVEKFL